MTNSTTLHALHLELPIDTYLDEFVFRWNRRRHYRSAFDTLLGIGLRTAPMDYWTLIGRPSPHRGEGTCFSARRYQ